MLTRLNSFDQIEEGWCGLLSTGAMDTVFVTPQWQRIWWREFGAGTEMLLLCLSQGNGVDGIASLIRREGRITLLGDSDLCDYNDLLVSPGYEKSFCTQLLDYLDDEEWEALELFPLGADSPALSFLGPMARERGCTVEVRQEDVAPGLGLPTQWDEYLQGLSGKDRHELRRKLRRLASSGEYRWYCLSERAEVEEDLGDFFSLLRESREDKKHFLTPQREKFFRSVATQMAAVGQVKLCFLELGGQRVAAALCFDYGQSRMLYNSGFNPAYGYYSVGLLVKALCLKDAIESGYQYFDFLRGDEAYKYDLGGKDRVLYRMVVKRG